MLQNLSMSEYVEWLAYFGVDWATWKPDQTPEAIQANLSLALVAAKPKKPKNNKKKPNAA